MPQIPVLNGVYADAKADFRVSYPRNLVPVPTDNGISKGYLRPAPGLKTFCEHGIGLDRGGIAWNGACYRVVGDKLIRISADGSWTELGAVGGGAEARPVALDYSFTALGIVSNGALYYADEAGVRQVTDSDLGYVVDATFIAGYWMFTDGTYVGVTDLSNPFAVNPVKYETSDLDPDKVVGLQRIREEVMVVSRHSTETFQNVGGSGFPFAAVRGSQVMKGCLGTHALCAFEDSLAMLGSGRNEPPDVFLVSGGTSVSIATREICKILAEYAEAQLSQAVLEARVHFKHSFLYVHLVDRTLVYDLGASRIAEAPVWYDVDSGAAERAAYRARGFVWAYDRWIAGDPAAPRACTLDEDDPSHYGAEVGWEFSTPIIYLNGDSGIIHELELVTLPGRQPQVAAPTIMTAHSHDGATWSVERATRAGVRGDRARRIAWLQLGLVRHWRIQRFRGFSDANLSLTRLEARIEPLNSKRRGAYG